ncbi:calponin homology domain-containing protein [Melanogaster broomeanus]|nr:calponin homology domain-containing protein [Melanogaster broomeanus]
MAELRTYLLAWVNELLQLNYTKVEQCGTGAAYCQILDSIYGDVPMSRVKMNARHNYEYVANFKILQTAFTNKKIDKPILVDKLAKCKMQDNLEFLQWMKRFWDQNYGGQGYDAVARRRGAPTDTPATIAPLSGPRSGSAGLGVGAGRSGGKTPISGHRATSTQPNEAILNLQAQLRDMSTHMEGLEKERDFYFAKLRDIEILAQQQVEVLEKDGQQDETLKEIQKILYSTEDGFEVPENAVPADEEETF